jgi:Tfp pilus assembly protein PilF
MSLFERLSLILPVSTPLRPATARRRKVVFLTAFAFIFIGLRVFSVRDKSATIDEPTHLVAGYAILVHGDYRIDPAHPPFLRVWAALPLLAMKVAGGDTAQIGDLPSPQWLASSGVFVHDFMYRNNDADRLLNAGRLMVIVAGLALGLMLFCWTFERLGFAPAAVTLAFYTIEPNVAAHSRLVTTDVGAACFIFGAIYFLWRTRRQVTWLNVAGLTVCCALAAVSKFSAVLLAPIVCLLLFLSVLNRSITVKAAAMILVVVFLASAGAIWGAYGFRYAPSASPEWLLRTDDFPIVRTNVPFLAEVLTWIDAQRLLPNAFTQGFLLSQATSKLPAYLMGNISNDGWWYYFPVAFLVKTPTALITLFLIGICMALNRRKWIDISFALLPIGIYGAFAMASGINIGLRHLLPIYPFVLLAAGLAIKALLAWRPAGLSILIGLMGFSIATFVRVYPHTLTFFNTLAGGPANGLHYLADSNLDWGQDLKLLKIWMERKNIRHINLAYFGSADPEYYGISCTHLPGAPPFATEKIAKPDLPGYVAISATVLSGIQLAPEWRLFYRGFLEEKLVAAVGNSIYVYWVERWPEAEEESAADAQINEKLADGLLAGLRWPEHAIIHYRASLESAPGDVEVLEKLGLLFESQEDYDHAVSTLVEAAQLAPGNGRVRRELAYALVMQQNFKAAVAHAEAAARLTPDDASAHDVLGLALALTGEFDEAEAAFRQSLRLDPSDETVRESFARLQEYRKRRLQE